MTVRQIPVLMLPGGSHTKDLVGFGELTDNGELILTIRSEKVVELVERLVDMGDIRELYLGLGFTIPRPETALEGSPPDG